MEFNILKNATLPLLKLQVVKDGRSSYQEFMKMIEESAIFFSMVNTQTGIPKITSRPAGFVEKTFIDPNAETEYYIYYQFTNRDTNSVGRYEGQFLLRNSDGVLIIPIREKLFINVQESFIADDLPYDSCYVVEFPCCVNPLPVPTPTPSPSPSICCPCPTPTPTPSSEPILECWETGFTLTSDFVNIYMLPTGQLINGKEYFSDGIFAGIYWDNGWYYQTLSDPINVSLITTGNTPLATFNLGEITGQTYCGTYANPICLSICEGEICSGLTTAILINSGGTTYYIIDGNNQIIYSGASWVFKTGDEPSVEIIAILSGLTESDLPVGDWVSADSYSSYTISSTAGFCIDALSCNCLTFSAESDSAFSYFDCNSTIQIVELISGDTQNVCLNFFENGYTINELYSTISGSVITIPCSSGECSAFTSNILGRIYVEDNRDNNYLISQLPRVGVKKPTSTYWNADEWWGNQGNTPQCVGYAWAHWVEDGPITHGGVPPIINPTIIYREAQLIDEWPGTNYDGTSVRAGAKYLKNINKIQNYYWAFDLNTLVDTVLTRGPVVVGTNWYKNMFYPDRNGVIRIGGRIAGGHAYVINGVDTKTKMFRIKNSWGRNWGKQGHAFISFNDMTRLIRESGEICLAIENQF